MKDGLVERDSPAFHRVLYTKQLVKKKKTYHDGFLRVNDGKNACLIDETGQKLAAGRLPTNCLPLSPEIEGTCINHCLKKSFFDHI